MTQKCGLCGKGKLRKTKTEERRPVAGHVFVATLPALACDACGENTIELADLERFELAIAQTLLESGESSGDAFRFSRKALGISGAGLAAELGVAPETLSRWETGRHRIEPAALGLLAVLVREAAAGSTSTLDMLRARREGARLAPRVALELAS